MRHSRVVLFALGGAALEIATPASGVDSSWSPARETLLASDGANDAQVALGFSPRPTEPAALFGRMLLPRQDFTMGPATCGFVATESNSFTCITNGATCTPQGGYVGCCSPNSACSAIKTTCINYASSSAGACNLPSDYHTLCCATSTLAECYTWVVSTTAKTDTSIEPYTLFACSATGGRGTLLTRDPAWPDPTTPPSSPAQSTSSAPAETTSAAASPPPGSKKSSTNLGAIIGGAVGGAAGLGLIGLAAFLIMRRKKSDAAAARPDSTIPQPMSPTSPDVAYANAGQPGYQYGPLPPQPGAPQPNYDPSMAYNGQAYQQYPPQQQYGAYPPQQAYAAHLAPSSSVSPPPVSPNSPQPSELNGAPAPLGAEGNRAELPSS